LINAHPRIVAMRHPDLAAIKEYVDNRDTILAQTHSDRAIAKQLYIRLLYGGTTAAWSRANGNAPVPKFATLFERDMAEARRRDLAAVDEADLHKIREESARVEEFVQYMLNTVQERACIDAIAAVINQSGGSILAYEHDGLYIHYEGDIDTLKAQIISATTTPTTIVPTKSIDDALKRAYEVIKSQAPVFAKLVTRTDAGWQEHYDLIRRGRNEKLGSHGLFAAIVMRSPIVAYDIPYEVRELVKLTPTSERFTWFNPKLKCWSQGGTAGEDALKLFITHICRRDLSEYSLVAHTLMDARGCEPHVADGMCRTNPSSPESRRLFDRN
jgi:hypothetical protein